MEASGGGTGGSGSRGSRLGEIPAVFGGRYETKRLLGKGGQGFVCLARDTNLDIDVAVKVLFPEYREEPFVSRFKTEARTMVELTQRRSVPNIVRISDFNADYPYLVMEYCGEGDLNERIKRRQPMPVSESLGITRQICEALVAAHENTQPILHRDIKPSNVFFHHGVAKVADFGLAKMVGSGTGQTTMGGVMGTVRYCSPEQLRDARRVDHRADLWSIGIILYELLTWMRPFDKADDSFVNIALRVHTEPPQEPPYEIPAPIWKVIERALQKRPDDRFQSAREMMDAIDEALREMPDAAMQLLPPESVLDEAGRIAAEVAIHLEQGRSRDAESRVKDLLRVAPDDSLTRYWGARIRESKGVETGISSGKVVDTADRERVAWLEKRFKSVQSLIQGRSYRDARRLIGEILVNDPDNTVAQRWLEQVSQEEKRLREDLEAANRNADSARSRGELEAVCSIWSGLLTRWPDLQEAQAELAVATRELGLRAQKAAREEAKRLVAESRGRGDVGAALEAWRSYMQAFPQDGEAPRLEVELTEALRQKESAARLTQTTEEGARLEAKADLEGALAAWKRLRQEDPDLAEAASAIARLTSAVARREEVRLRSAAQADAEARAVAGDFRGATTVWEGWLARRPDDANAVAERDAMARRAVDQEKTAAARDLEHLLVIVEAATAGGRYASSGAGGPKLAESVRSARARAMKDVREILQARRELIAARGAAEAGLRRAMAEARLRLVARAEEARGSLSDEEEASAREEPLRSALSRSIAALTHAGLAPGPTDPVAALLDAEKALALAQEALDRGRRDAIASARKKADAALESVKAALGLLEGQEAQAEGGVSAASGAAGFREAFQAARERASAKDPVKILEAAAQASALRSEIEAATSRSSFARAEVLSALVDQATMILPHAKGGKLAGLMGQAARSLEPDKGKGGASQNAPAGNLKEVLTVEITVEQKGFDERLAKSRQRWKSALDTWTSVLRADLGSPLAARGDAVRNRGATALADGRAEQLDMWAGQLEALTRRYRVESVWISESDSVLEAEGALDPDGLPVAADGERRSMLERFRKAAASGDAKEMAALAPAFQKLRDDASARPERSTDSVTAENPGELPAAIRRFNQKINPDGLRAFEDLHGRYRKASSQGRRGEAAQIFADLSRARRRLIKPEPAWKRAIPAAAAVMVVLVAVWLALPEQPQASGDVRVMSPNGAAEVISVARDGSPVDDLKYSIPATGVNWTALIPGQYVIQMKDGATAKFTVPGPSEVLLPTQSSGYSTMLKEALDLDSLVKQP